ncbi:MAG TPA: hypothetical protein VE888_17210 [Streptosporangiaceae bacterium]|nr:hypothetical protein [Streptosporangiaceae bacterium]
MNNDAKGKARPQVRSGPLITGAVLVGAGTFFVLIGLVVGSSHLLSVTRQRVREMEMEVPPNELAKQKYAQARAAVAPGTAAWQSGIPAQAASVS